MSILKKLWKKKWVLRSILKTIYFNFHYLQFKQALRLPILLYKPKFMDLKGSIEITAPIRTGMICLGNKTADIYPNTGIIIENHGGRLILNGDAVISNGTSLTVGKDATLALGHKFMANAGSKIIFYHKMQFDDFCLIAWEVIIMDSDFHTLTKSDGSHTKGYAPIKLGKGCWIGTRVVMLKGTELPAYTTVQANTTLHGKYEIPEKSVIGADANVVVKAADTYRDYGNDKIKYAQTQ